jgi:DNA polymerase-3 subunit alpha
MEKAGQFYVEGYDESFEFRIFGEEYLKFSHFLIQNNFTFLN